MLVCAPLGLFVWKVPYPHLKLASPVPFERAAWEANAEPFCSEPSRYRMAKHIAVSGELIGMQETEVREMLDTPLDPGTPIGPDMRVWAVKRLGGSDSLFLQVAFDEQRRVVRVIGPRG